MDKKKLNIGINLLYMNRKLAGGSITYGINLVNELSKVDKFNNYTIYINKDCKDLPLELDFNYKIKVIPFSNKNVFVRYFWEQFFFPIILLWEKLDMLHSLGYVGPLVCPTKHVVSILDLNYKRHKESMSLFKRILLGSMIKLMARYSNKIITISNFSKKEICDVLKVNENKIAVTHLSGTSDLFNDIDTTIDFKELYNIDSDYIIAFGSPSSHKNILGLISAFSILKDEYKSLNLILVGHQHSNNELNKHILNLELDERVLFTGFVPYEHIYPLIKKSKLFVFPSFYEGFGIPLLDAQSLGVPVASSNAASLPEVGKDGALYFDPNNIQEMSNVIKYIIQNIAVSNQLVENGYLNRRNFSWNKTATKTLENYYLVTT